MRVTRPTAAGWLATVALTLAVTACGGSTDPQVDTAATGATPPSTQAAGDEVARYVESVRAWVKCLREQGYPQIPDPDAKGQVDLAEGGVSKRDSKAVAAMRTCDPLRQEVPAVLQEPEGQLTPEQIQWARDFAACMRANGMPDWRDPGPDGQGGGYARELTPQEQRANILAIQICEPVQLGQPAGTAAPSAPDPQG